MGKASLKKQSLVNSQQLTVKKFLDWISGHKLEVIILGVILVVGAFFRLYKISEYMTFLGDEGRDAIIVRRLLVNFDPILVGPGTSIGNMYLGPLYYYMMAPALLLAGFSPVGPAVQIALLGVVTIALVWWIGREWFGLVAGLIAAGLYAVAPTVIIYSRSSWNPNIMPFFALISIYSIWKVFVPGATGIWPGQKRFRWLVVLGVSYAFVLQSHYLGLLLGPTLLLFWILSLINIHGSRITDHGSHLRNFLRHSLIGGLLFLLLMSPLVIFDARHGWRNFDAIKKFFTERQTTISARPWTSIPKIGPISEKVTTRLVTGTNDFLGKTFAKIFTILAIGTFAIVLYKAKFLKNIPAAKRLNAYFLIFTWLGVALIGLGIYKQEIYDHYYGFFFASPFLLFGGLVQELFVVGKKNIKFFYFSVTAIFMYILISVNLHNNPLKYPPNRQLQRTEEVAKKIAEESGNEKFNLAVLAERNYDDAYQYFLEWWEKPIVDIDPQKADETITQQLFVVCEFAEKEKCNPTNNPKAEIANFGWSKIENEWQVAGVTLYKLIHSQP